MKFCCKILAILGIVFVCSPVSGKESLGVAYKANQAVTTSDLLVSVPKLQDVIKPVDLEKDARAGLLNQPIPKLTEVWTLNPPNIINHEIKLFNGNALRSYRIEYFELTRSHWVLETKARMAMGLCGAYAFLNWGIPVAYMVVSPMITTVALIMAAGGGLYYYSKDLPAFQGLQEKTQAVLSEAIEKKGREIKEKTVSAVQDLSTTITLGHLLKEKNMTMVPTYTIDEEGAVRCVYEGSIDLSYGQLLNFKIILHPLSK